MIQIANMSYLLVLLLDISIKNMKKTFTCAQALQRERIPTRLIMIMICSEETDCALKQLSCTCPCTCMFAGYTRSGPYIGKANTA